MRAAAVLWEMVDEEERDTCPVCITAIARMSGRSPESVERSSLVRCPKCKFQACQMHITVHSCLDAKGNPPTEEANRQMHRNLCCNAPECPHFTSRPFCLNHFQDHRGWACSKACLIAAIAAGQVAKETVPKTCLECVHAWHRWREFQQMGTGRTPDPGRCVMLDVTYNRG